MPLPISSSSSLIQKRVITKFNNTPTFSSRYFRILSRGLGCWSGNLRSSSPVRFTPATGYIVPSSTKVQLFSTTTAPDKMATTRKIQLSTSDSGIYNTGARADAAQAASEVLQEDLEKHHALFNDQGFHNHIVHHILTIYSLGASPEDIRAAYDRNKTYQRPSVPVNEDVVQSLGDKTKFKNYFGQQEHYHDFLAYFQQEIDKKGVNAVLDEYLFSGDECAEAMFVRLFSGLLHPWIHLGFGIEFSQPAIVAEALAETAIHNDWIGSMFLWPAEKVAGGTEEKGKKPLARILEGMHADKKLIESTHYGDGMRTGVLKRAPDELAKYAAEYTVSEDKLEERLAELTNTIVAYAAAAQRPLKQVKFDFFLIHGVNSTIFFEKIFALPSLDIRFKCRLLEWMGRMILFIYAMCGLPDPLLNEVKEYQTPRDWGTVFTASVEHPREDGHLPKLVRAVTHGERICRPFDDQGKEQRFLISGDDWLKIGNMAIDSVSDNTCPLWVRLAGFEQAWDEFADRSRL